MDEAQVSWLVVEPGWAVVAADGSDIGHVQEVVGDESKDIFDGLAVTTSVFADAKYVRAEKVGRIVDGRVELRVPSNDEHVLTGLFEEPPSEEFGMRGAIWPRVRTWLASLRR